MNAYKSVCIGKVMYVDDEYSGGRIKVYIDSMMKDKAVSGTSETNKIQNLVWCYPLMSNLIHLMPKVGEAVLVILAAAGDDEALRYWVGPIISQPNYTPFCDFSQALSLMPGGQKKEKKPLSLYTSSYGSMPNIDDVAILGRNNSDIILSEKNIRIRCGERQVDTNSTNGSGSNDVIRNKVHDSAFINLGFPSEDMSVTPKYANDEETYDKDKEKVQVHSNATIVADQINLIGNYGSVGSDTASNVLYGQDGTISNEMIQKVAENCHPAVYGDNLVDFLKLFLDVFQHHVHNYPGNPPIIEPKNNRIWTYDWGGLLSKSVKLN